jgi:hypothetical protein
MCVPAEAEAGGPNPTVPTICNLSHPAHQFFGELTEGTLGTAHGWLGPGKPGRTMATVIGYHDTGPGAWTECLNLVRMTPPRPPLLSFLVSFQQPQPQTQPS